jgi:hypothetical protein
MYLKISMEYEALQTAKAKKPPEDALKSLKNYFFIEPIQLHVQPPAQFSNRYLKNVFKPLN